MVVVLVVQPNGTNLAIANSEMNLRDGYNGGGNDEEEGGGRSRM